MISFPQVLFPMRSLLILLAATTASAQFVSSVAIPKGPNPPVVFLNGYQADCRGSSFPGTFGAYDRVLQTQNRVTLFFDNCAFTTGTKPSIEELGNTFALYLGSLRYTDNTPVPVVDIIAHSMGGLIVRSYLEGKQLDGTYTPPLTPPVRKIIFLATPHFGTPISLGFSFDKQLEELAEGSIFLFDLNTWNQGTDDLRGLDVLAIAGEAGTATPGLPAFDDGIVPLSSASLGFARPEDRTRILPVCHTGPGVITAAGLCPAGTPGIAAVNGIGDIPARIVVSFLGDGPEYKQLGKPTSEDTYLFNTGGVYLRAKSASGQDLPITKATASGGPLKISAAGVAYSEYFPFPTELFTLTAGAKDLTQTVRLNTGTFTTRILKDGPQIARVLPSAANITPLAVGANSYISIYGTGLDRAQVTTGTIALTVLATSPNQVNAVLVSDPAKLVIPITVTTPNGSDTINVFTPPNVPALFTQNATGAGPASALNAVSNVLITPNAPIHAGEYVSLYLTGLTFPPLVAGPGPNVSVTVSGRACPIQFAGVAPGYTALDQINCQVPGGISSTVAPVVVTVDGRTSNTVTLAVLQ